MVSDQNCEFDFQVPAKNTILKSKIWLPQDLKCYNLILKSLLFNSMLPRLKFLSRHF